MKDGNGNGVTFKWLTGIFVLLLISIFSFVLTSFATDKADKEVVAGEIRRLDDSDKNIKEDIADIKSDLKEMKRDQKEMIKMLTRIDARQQKREN